MTLARVHGWEITPQAQVIYQHISLDDMRDQFGIGRFSDQSVVTGRLGLQASRTFLNVNGVDLHIWGRANLWHAGGDFGDLTVTNLQGQFPARFSLGKSGTWAGIEAGVSAQLNANAALFATAAYEPGIGGGRDGDHSLAGRVGLQVKW